MKYVLTVILAMAAIIAAQAGLTYVFNFHVGETFSRTATGALFFYSVIRLGRRARQAA